MTWTDEYPITDYTAVFNEIEKREGTESLRRCQADHDAFVEAVIRVVAALCGEIGQGIRRAQTEFDTLSLDELETICSDLFRKIETLKTLTDPDDIEAMTGDDANEDASIVEMKDLVADLRARIDAKKAGLN